MTPHVQGSAVATFSRRAAPSASHRTAIEPSKPDKPTLNPIDSRDSHHRIRSSQAITITCTQRKDGSLSHLSVNLACFRYSAAWPMYLAWS